MLSIKQLTYALAVEKTLHFRKAAELCAISQSALSTALHELEKQIGTQLFERDNKKVLVTAQGRLFLDKARQVKQDIDDLQQMMNSLKAPLSFPMTIGAIPTISPFLLPKVLPALRADFPDFKLHILEEQSHILVEKVKNGEIDAAILALPYPLDGLLSFTFWQEDFYLVTHKDSPEAAKVTITSAQIDENNLMLLKDGHCLKDHALAACKLKSRPGNQTVESTSLHTLIQMVAGKLGTTLIPHMALETLVTHSNELKAVRLNEKGPHRTIAFIVRPNYVALDSIQLLMKHFKAQLSTLQPSI